MSKSGIPCKPFRIAMRANLSHGHHKPRRDMARARCGGPMSCAICWLQNPTDALTAQILHALGAGWKDGVPIL